MAYIGNLPAVSYASFSKQNLVADGSTVAFTLDYAVANENDLEVFVNNVRQEPGSGKAYTASGTTLTMSEAPASGASFYVIFQGKATQTVVTPDNSVTTAKIANSAVTNAKLSNSSITINGTSIALGASGTIVAGTDWQSVVVADGSTGLTTEAGKGYFIDTTSGAITVTLPNDASSTRGDTIVLRDYASTFSTNIVTLTSTAKISGADQDSFLNTNDLVITLVYADTTKGWVTLENEAKAVGAQDLLITALGGTIITSGDYKIHTFTGDGCFSVLGVSPDSPGTVDYLVVAGGAGGAGDSVGSSVGGGGGGAGGFRESHSVPVSGCYTASPLATPTGITVSTTTYPISVGAGGIGGTAGPSGADATNGSNSIFSTITSTGGGKGAAYNIYAGSTGGSGGGGSYTGGGGGYPGYAGNTPPTSPPQGNAGGNSETCNQGGGGGGGAGGTGGPPSSSVGGAGGAGSTTSITGSPVAYAGGGGGGGGYLNVSCGGSGGTGGGGTGGGNSPVNGTAGTTNTGGGGGGGMGYPGTGSGAAGGSGVVIIRYKFQ